MRAEILTPPDEDDRLQLLFVDFGTIDYVPIENIRYLRWDLCEMSRFCHRGVLDIVVPLNDHKMEQKIIKTFCQLVSDKSVMAVVSDVDEVRLHLNDFCRAILFTSSFSFQYDSICVTLIDTNSPDDDIIINKILMEMVPSNAS